MDERRRCIGEMFINPEYGNESDILVDVSGITNAPTGAEFIEVGNFAKLLHTRFTGRIAIVNRRAGHFTVSQLVALSADLGQQFVRFFYTEAEALDWLHS